MIDGHVTWRVPPVPSASRRAPDSGDANHSSGRRTTSQFMERESPPAAGIRKRMRKRAGQRRGTCLDFESLCAAIGFGASRGTQTSRLGACRANHTCVDGRLTCPAASRGPLLAGHHVLIRALGGLIPCYLEPMQDGDRLGGATQGRWRNVWLLWIGGTAACIYLASCSSPSKDGTSSSSWTCFKTGSDTEPCQCQTTPVGGKHELLDRCSPDLVQVDGGPAEAECCKDWLWLNGKQVSAYYCSCYAKGVRSCNVAIGDELVDSCP